MMLIVFSAFFISKTSTQLSAEQYISKDNIISTSDLKSNSKIIEDILDGWIANYSENNYFSQEYIPSLQGTFYALYIFEALDKLDIINQTNIGNYVLDQFNDDYNFFIDDYVNRYMDQNYNWEFYPLTSILEINCYAILTLDILDQLDKINTEDMIQFIWSCYDSNAGGFIGQTYDPNLEEGFKTATLDNTYYAVKTLDILMENWNAYTNEIDAIINYINDLQNTIPEPIFFGGFLNDNNSELDSLKIFEPNILSSYYAIKTLEIFNMIGTIRIDDINQYFDFLYQEEHNYFEFSVKIGYANFAATSIGLDLSIITGNTNINETALLEFLIDNRNEFGIWDISTSYYNSHELIDTFQIIRSLRESQNLNILTSIDKIKITNALNMYKSYKGYAFTSNKLTKQEFLYSIIESFDLYDRISDLDIHELYKKIEFSYYKLNNESCGFYSYININENYNQYRTYPVEHFNFGEHNHLQEIDYIYSHKNVYMALKSLEILYKLDDFEVVNNLEELLNSTINSQFLQESSEKFGLFLSYLPPNFFSIERKEKLIFFEHAYYAVKTIEYLSQYLNLGNISQMILDKTALITYLVKNIVETPTTMYFNDSYNFNIENTLQNTYFLIDMSDILGESLIDAQKIRTFILENIDYTNIKNIYYCYKINEILSLDINFNFNLAQSLVKVIYSEQSNNFYLTSDHERIDSEILYWICYMAKNNDLEINMEFEENILIHSENFFNISINNIILEDYSPYSIVKFESDQLGTILLNKQEDNSFYGIISIPLDSSNYPVVYGNISLYEGTLPIFTKNISIQTSYSLDYSYNITKIGDSISVELNSSLITGYGREAFSEKEAFLEIYINEALIRTESLSMTEENSWNEFLTSYKMSQSGDYTFKLFLDDGLASEPLEITVFETNHNENVLINPSTLMMPLGIFMIGMPGSLFVYTTYRKNKNKLG
ncbi:MAG: hypothetical protein KGD63_14240 [Candidatus Lokiarchaeota archaeon]|nr:hypothetical protein [Candidatus Lokiarchaeota archaeon]